MFQLVLVLACVAGALASPLDGRIVGGSPAGAGQFPHQISMRQIQSGQHYCGGSIINSRIILTAAHCVYGQQASNFFIVAGTTLLSDQGGQRVGCSQFIPHEEFSQQNLLNDIALIVMSDSLQMNNLVQPIQLETGDLAVGSPLILSGWGLESGQGSGPPNNLLYAVLNSISLEQCSQELGNIGVIGTGHICTFTRIGQGSCNGDSGGPLIYNNRQVGVVSWGRPCATGVPDVFTSVQYYDSWIRQYVQQY